MDIACVGFGPAMGGFSPRSPAAGPRLPTTPPLTARPLPGMPLQVLCYERADDIAAGVSGVVTRARGIRASFPGFNPAEVPMAAAVAWSASSTCSTPPAPAAVRSRCAPPTCCCARSAASHACRTAPSNSLDARLPAQARRPGALPRPVQPVGRRAVDGRRTGADLARLSGERALFPAARCRASAWPTRASTATARPPTAIWPEWTCALPSPSLATARSAPSVRPSTAAAACLPATRSASGRWA